MNKRPITFTTTNVRRRKTTVRRGIACVLVALVPAAAALAEDWTVLRPNNRPYVTFANVAQFYQFPEYTRVSRTVSLRSERRTIRAQAGTSELSINGVRFFTHFPLLNSNNEDLISVMDVSKIIEPVLRPSRIQKSEKVETIVLDPGHGGSDNGASSSWGSEKNFNLDVALAARRELIRAGYRVEMTRATDTAVSLEERVSIANRFSRAVFVSIHFNSSAGGVGVESYALAPEGVTSNMSSDHHVSAADVARHAGNAQDERNIALTASIHASVLTRLAAFDRGVRHARFHVLRDVKIPAVLVEGGFLSNPSEGQRIATSSYRQRLGTAIAQGVQNYNAAVNYRTQGANFAVAKVNLPPHARSITDPLGVDPPVEQQQPHQPSISINPGE
ncbi:MAG TPA: N-acetylmuramoyl-L-alanine amidase [Chthoniobacterales bacterium]|nr:N-acetylmuramoyl-L-alanine amidase [Chthoniobacterales bacterium]